MESWVEPNVVNLRRLRTFRGSRHFSGDNSFHQDRRGSNRHLCTMPGDHLPLIDIYCTMSGVTCGRILVLYCFLHLYHIFHLYHVSNCSRYHFEFDFDFGWGGSNWDGAGRTLDTAMKLMHRLRQAGIRAHFWI